MKVASKQEAVSGQWPVARNGRATDHWPLATRRAFTIMELMVSITILVVVILGVGLVFSGASRAVGVSQATMDMLGNERMVNQALERNIQEMDKNAFLAIRQRVVTINNVPYHYDQISFIALGSFPDRTGNSSNPSAPFTNPAVATAAHVWIGQLVLESANIPQVPGSGYTNPDGTLVGPNQGNATAVTAYPTGFITGSTPNTGFDVNGHTLLDDNGALGVHLLMLYPGPASGNAVYPSANTKLMAYSTADIAAGTVTPGGEASAAHITSSRVDAVAESESQLLTDIQGKRTTALPWPELTNFCYRFRALNSIVDTEVTANPFVNGYYRTTPIALQGVSTLKIEWTDGGSYANGTNINGVNVSGQTRWYGYSPYYNASYEGTHGGNPPGQINVAGTNYSGEYPGGYGGVLNVDSYDVVFNYANRAYWPKAIRLSYHVADSTGRLQGGRDFVQVIHVPD